MDLSDKVVVVTGGASGIGRALCNRFAREGARGVVVADLDGAGAATVADAISAGGGTALAVSTDVAVEADVVALVDKATDTYGPIDLFCANAGIAVSGSVDAPDDVADAVVAGLAAERFLILPHPEVAEYLRRKAGDYDRWLAGMRRLQSRVMGPPQPLSR